LHSLVGIAQKEERENDQTKRDKHIKRKENCYWGPSGNKKERVPVPFQYKEVLLV
jgi:hypothetical protein